MTKRLKFLAIAALIASLGIHSCSLLTDEVSQSSTGRIVVHVTDAPFPANLVEHVFVTVDSVSLRHEDGKCKDGEGEEYSCDSGFILVLEDPVTIDLLLLRNGLTELLVDAEIPVGKYDMIRLHTKDARIVVEPGVEYDLKLNGSHSEVKIKFKDPIEITEDGLAEILVDFDLSKSFVVQGNPKSKAGIRGFIFKPVIRAVDINKSGSISGKVTGENNQPLENAGITLYAGTESVATAVTGSQGEFTLAGISPGNYKLVIEADGYKPEEIQVTVAAKKKENLKNNIRLTKL